MVLLRGTNGAVLKILLLATTTGYQIRSFGEAARKVPGVDQVITIAGVSPIDNNSALASAGVAYIVLKDWSERGKGEEEQRRHQ